MKEPFCNCPIDFQVYNSTSQVYPAATQAYSNATQQYANSPAAQTYSNSTQSYSNAAQPYGSAVAQQAPYSNNTSSNATTQQPYNASQPSYGNQATTSYNNAVSQTYGSSQPNYGGSAGTNSYAATYQTGATTYGAGQEVQQVHQPQRAKTQRARVPPPSKVSNVLVIILVFLAVLDDETMTRLRGRLATGIPTFYRVFRYFALDVCGGSFLQMFLAI